MAKLTPEQITKVSAWVAEGATLSQIQERLSSQLEISMTYMDVRFLVDDLNLALVEKEEPKKPEEPAVAEAAPAEAAAPAPATQGAGVVTVEVDTIAQPHAMVSGHVTFSDGEKADWYIDHQGRPGMAARTPGYRPTPQDITDFQVKLDAALRQAGY
ncbi:MAG: hypothetical protein RLZZ322_528 [Verrucomicrobiota bacterium]|jgi:hypothetical protein